jgi:divalent anion:Na+ symporter, DASS family
MSVPAHPLMETASVQDNRKRRQRRALLKWCPVIFVGLVIAMIPPPAGVTPQGWRLLAIFAATIAGSIFQPVPGAAVVLLGVSAAAFTGALPVAEALGGYANPIVWMVLAAFFISRGMVNTGLGRRVAFLFIRTLGNRSLGLGYALVCTDMLLAMVIPSNGARAGGVLFPITKSLAEAYDSRPGPTAARLGAFLMCLVYQCEVIICAMFLTGQASNVLIAKFAQEITGQTISYSQWALAAIVPGIVSLLVVPQLIYRVFPPEIKHTPAAASFARGELKRMGAMSGGEKLMLLTFLLVASLWMTSSLHGLHYAVVALLGICVLLLSGVLQWDDVLGEKGAWDVFIWYGGLVRMAEGLGEAGLTRQFAESAASFTAGWSWAPAMAVLLFVYFYAHYGFASITAHVSAMYTPFLVVILAAGAPPYLALFSLAVFSNLNASLTHYGTTPAPIYFGAGYVTQQTWWRLGLLASLANIPIWVIVGFAWWKILGLW